MVWSTTQSALYDDLRQYFEDEKKPEKPEIFEPQKICEKESENECEKCPENNRKSSCENEPEKCPPKMPEHCENHEEKREPRREKPHCPDRPYCPACQSCQVRAQNPLSNLLADKDMLLIAGLILLLIKQGADQKLILALVFVLLG